MIRRSLRFQHPCHREPGPGHPQGRGSSCVGRCLIVFCANGVLSESLHDVSAKSQAVFTSPLRMTVRPICNHLSHGDTAYSDAPLCASPRCESYNSHGGPPYPFWGRIRKVFDHERRETAERIIFMRGKCPTPDGPAALTSAAGRARPRARACQRHAQYR